MCIIGKEEEECGSEIIFGGRVQEFLGGQNKKDKREISGFLD